MPAQPKPPASPRRGASPAHTAGAPGLAPRTRSGGRGQGRRHPARRRPKRRAGALPGGRVPGRRPAVPKAWEGPLDHAQRPIASTPRVVVLARAVLLALGRGLGGSAGEHPGGGRRGGTREAVVDQGVGESGAVRAGDAGCKARNGGHARRPGRALRGAAPRCAAPGGRAGGAWPHGRPHTRRRFAGAAGRRGPGEEGRERTDAACPGPQRHGVR